MKLIYRILIHLSLALPIILAALGHTILYGYYR